MSSEFEVQEAPPVLRAETGTPDRARARELFEQLATLPADNPERARIRGYLVELHLPLVEYLARRFRNRGEWLDDLTQVATIGLIKSIDRFDLERGVEFSTYATPTIVGEIKRHFRDKGWAVRVPRRLQELKLSLTKAISELAQREGRAPTVSELAAHLQMSEEEVLEGLESANAYSTVSLDAPDSGDEDAPAVADSLGMLDDALEGVEYRESLKPLLEQLPPREKKILLLRFFGNMTQSQIAAELGISQMHVSRLLARTLAQLREGLTTDDLSLLSVERLEAVRREQRDQRGNRQHQHRDPPVRPVAVKQVQGDADAGELRQQHRSATPQLELVQRPADIAQADRHAESDERERDTAGRLVGLSADRRGGRVAGRDQHSDSLGEQGNGRDADARGWLPGRRLPGGSGCDGLCHDFAILKGGLPGQPRRRLALARARAADR